MITVGAIYCDHGLWYQSDTITALRHFYREQALFKGKDNLVNVIICLL
jgi:hypothetical protein